MADEIDFIQIAQTYQIGGQPLTEERVERALVATVGPVIARRSMRRIKRGKLTRVRIRAAVLAVLRDAATERAVLRGLERKWSPLYEDLVDLIWNIAPNEQPFVEWQRDSLNGKAH